MAMDPSVGLGTTRIGAQRGMWAEPPGGNVNACLDDGGTHVTVLRAKPLAAGASRRRHRRGLECGQGRGPLHDEEPEPRPVSTKLRQRLHPSGLPAASPSPCPARTTSRARSRSNVIDLSLIHISEPTRRTPISYAVFCLKK